MAHTKRRVGGSRLVEGRQVATGSCRSGPIGDSEGTQMGPGLVSQKSRCWKTLKDKLVSIIPILRNRKGRLHKELQQP